jgi:hypothetical protein
MHSVLYDFFRDQGSIIGGLLALAAGLLAFTGAMRAAGKQVAAVNAQTEALREQNSDLKDREPPSAGAGVAGMEVLARDLKALGLYAARSLSFEGIEYEIVEHNLSAEQIRIYDAYADAFQIIHKNLTEALKAANITGSDGDTYNRNAKAAARSAFESNKRRFFNHLLTAMKCPTLIAAIARNLEEGHACVLRVVSTNEALLDRRLAEIPKSEWADLSIDITPREYVLDYLSHSFPTQLFELYSDEEGNLHSRPAYDADGNPILPRGRRAPRPDDRASGVIAAGAGRPRPDPAPLCQPTISPPSTSPLPPDQSLLCAVSMSPATTIWPGSSPRSVCVNGEQLSGSMSASSYRSTATSTSISAISAPRRCSRISRISSSRPISTVSLMSRFCAGYVNCRPVSCRNEERRLPVVTAGAQAGG